MSIFGGGSTGARRPTRSALSTALARCRPGGPFGHGGAGLAEMAAWILARAGVDAHSVGVAIDIPHGPVVETMMERGFTVHSVNPKHLDRFRDRFLPAGAKDDRRDSRVLADALRTDGHAFRRLDPAAPEIVELREWSRIANDLSHAAGLAFISRSPTTFRQAAAIVSGAGRGLYVVRSVHVLHGITSYPSSRTVHDSESLIPLLWNRTWQ